MTLSTVHKSVFIAVPPEIVFAELSHPNNMLGLQPLVVEVSPVSREQDSNGNIVLSYQSVELFRFASLISYRNPIQVRSTLYPDQGKIVSNVKSRPNLDLEFMYDMVAVEGGTQLDLTVTYTAPSLIREFVLSQINMAQDGVLVSLKARLEARQ